MAYILGRDLKGVRDLRFFAMKTDVFVCWVVTLCSLW
jgi:hypothetical protein